jgi:pSer/pThr/pTyr-binding forkhead associated (FHA) protein
MAKLILRVNGVEDREYALGKERMTLGRHPHNDIQVDNPTTSGEHAAIVTILDDSFIEDLDSTNGTFVNGTPVKNHFLQDGDVIVMGSDRLTFVNGAKSSASVAEFEKTMDTRRGGSNQLKGAQKQGAGDTQVGADPPGEETYIDYAAPAPDGAAAGSVGMTGSIHVLDGPSAGRVLDLTKTLTTLGKPEVQVAVIARSPTGYMLSHKEGADFPLVNGNLLGEEAAELKDHDIVEIAGVKMEFFLKP